MALGLVEWYSNIINSGDKRSNQYPFVKDPVYVIVAAILYLIIVVVGPRLMKNREPFQFRGILIGYNFFSVLLSVFMMWEVRPIHYFQKQPRRCSIKKTILKIFAIFTEKHLCWGLFFIKLQAFRQLYEKRDSNADVFV